EGGDGGGEIIAAGSPEDVVKEKRSYTGQFLRPVLARRRGRTEAAEGSTRLSAHHDRPQTTRSHRRSARTSPTGGSLHLPASASRPWGGRPRFLPASERGGPPLPRGLLPGDAAVLGNARRAPPPPPHPPHPHLQRALRPAAPGAVHPGRHTHVHQGD